MSTAAMSQDTSERAGQEPEHVAPQLSQYAAGRAAVSLPLTPPPGLRRIVLTGFMGAGKSTVGRLLAERLGWRFIDVDLEIEAKAAMPPAEIFANLGEFAFRRMETSAIAHALGERNAVIALGGGAPEVLANRLLLEQTPHTAVALLYAPFSVLVERTAAQKNAAVRPNLRDLPAAEERYRYREPLYRRCARYRIDTEGVPPGESVDALLRALSS